MSTLTEAAAACCACLRVHWTETHHPDGSMSGRWLCTQCGNDFVPGGMLRFEQAKQAAFDARYRAAVQDNVRLVAIADESRANLTTAASVAKPPADKLEETKAEYERERGEVNEALREELARTGKLLNVLHRNGFRECDIAACSCGSWHPGPNLRAEKAEAERDEAEAVQQTQEDRGRELIAEADARAAEAEVTADGYGAACAAAEQLLADAEAECDTLRAQVERLTAALRKLLDESCGDEDDTSAPSATTWTECHELVERIKETKP